MKGDNPSVWDQTCSHLKVTGFLSGIISNILLDDSLWNNRVMRGARSWISPHSVFHELMCLSLSDFTTSICCIFYFLLSSLTSPRCLPSPVRGPLCSAPNAAMCQMKARPRLLRKLENNSAPHFSSYTFTISPGRIADFQIRALFPHVHYASVEVDEAFVGSFSGNGALALADSHERTPDLFM